MDKPITRALYLSFVWSFLVSTACWVGLIVLGVAPPRRHGSITSVEAILAFVIVILMLAASLVWYVSLGVLAHRLRRRWLVWVGLSFITSPIGPLIIFPLMLGHVRAARPPASAQ